MIMKIGVTGTRSGCTPHQLEKLKIGILNIIVEHGPCEFHHGDCIGVDAEAAIIARNYGCKIVCHPPIDDELRAYQKYDYAWEEKTYFARNRDIVNCSDILIVVPWQSEHSSKGGTWYTYDYAAKNNKKLVIIWPNGEVGI